MGSLEVLVFSHSLTGERGSGALAPFAFVGVRRGSETWLRSWQNRLQHLAASCKPKPSGESGGKCYWLRLKKQRVHRHQQDASRVTMLSIFKTNTHKKKKWQKWKQYGEISAYVTQAEIFGEKKKNQHVKLLGGSRRIVTSTNIRHFSWMCGFFSPMVKCQEISPKKPRSLLWGGEELGQDPH